ncbi:hypothetical protein SLA2020_367700 [Shorea laevis]
MGPSAWLSCWRPTSSVSSAYNRWAEAEDRADQGTRGRGIGAGSGWWRERQRWGRVEMRGKMGREKIEKRKRDLTF